MNIEWFKDLFIDEVKPALNHHSGSGSVTINNQDKIVVENGEYTADEGYTGLGKVTVNVEASGGSASDLTALLSGTITEISNENVTYIWKNTFFDMPVTRVDFPNVTAVGNDAFKGSKVTELSFPKLTTAGNGAFSYCAMMVTFDAPNLEIIPSGAFTQSKLLESIGTCAATVTSIGSSAFSKCSALKEAIFPAVTKMMQNALQECVTLEYADFAVITSMAAAVFYGCTNLKTVIIRTQQVCALGNITAFGNTPFASGGTGGTVYVPAALIESYKAATNWSTLYAAGSMTFAAIEGSEYE